MKIIYEPDGDVLEIRLTEEDWVKAVDINPDTVAHLDLQGRLSSIEVFGASEHYPLRELVSHSTEPLKSLSEAGETAGLAPDRLKYAAQRGELKAVKIGHRWATTRSWVMAYSKKQPKVEKNPVADAHRSEDPTRQNRRSEP